MQWNTLRMKTQRICMFGTNTILVFAFSLFFLICLIQFWCNAKGKRARKRCLQFNSFKIFQHISNNTLHRQRIYVGFSLRAPLSYISLTRCTCKGSIWHAFDLVHFKWYWDIEATRKALKSYHNTNLLSIFFLRRCNQKFTAFIRF